MINKKVVLISWLALVLLTACGQQGGKKQGDDSKVQNPKSLKETDTTNLPKISFHNKTYDFGKVKEGESVKHDYIFTNSGKRKLIISNTSASCGCTVPSQPESPVPPGATDTISVKFDSNGKSGQQHKTVTIHANTMPKKTKLHLKGKVIDTES